MRTYTLKDLSKGLPILTPVDLSYLAGLFDGEGYAGVCNKNIKAKLGRSSRIAIMPLMALQMTNRDPVYFYSLYFGGSCLPYQSERLTKKGTPEKLCYRWSLAYQKAYYVAKAIFPFVKNESKVRQLASIIHHYEPTWEVTE